MGHEDKQKLLTYCKEGGRFKRNEDKTDRQQRRKKDMFSTILIPSTVQIVQFKIVDICREI